MLDAHLSRCAEGNHPLDREIEFYTPSGFDVSGLGQGYAYFSYLTKHVPNWSSFSRMTEPAKRMPISGG